ncbi:conserved hypothetical protein [Paraburkholderia sabiae]|jgi:hypothetical protein|uniref:hypothetical protein n=1 Tax=Paraburkholderia sabiae TaxID=273251 RepID=UPI001CAB7BAA|nr:hypothetical protein [Paraburkholderia sabiae]CAG9203431.1 conserved hypothetical protein [Paraburkholderia sabiae]
MAGRKTLINHTGNDLEVTLIVRKGDRPEGNAGTVDVHLAAGPDTQTGKDGSRQIVTYGNDVDIYLNGIETTLIAKGAAIGKREVVVERGSAFDNQLNTNDTIEFLYDGHQVLVSASNSDDKPFTFASEP